MSTETRGPPPTSTETSPPSSTTQSGSATSTSNSDSFVGNTSSTVLFFLALAVGVFIALLFVFFTIRYFVRLKFGLHIYPISHRSIILASPSSIPRVSSQPYVSDADLQDQIAYIRENMFARGETFDRTIEGRRRRRRRRRRRGGRYSRMKKLTEEQVQLLFPQQTYHKWLNGGQEEDQENRGGLLQEEGMPIGEKIDENSVGEQNGGDNTPRDGIIEESAGVVEVVGESDLRAITSPKKIKSASNSIYPEADIDEQHVHQNTEEDGIELHDIGTSSSHTTNSNVKPFQFENDLHFTSGSCAICLETLEDDSIVRGLICGHVFHAECLDPWLTKRRACCPMCKRDYFYKDENNNSLNRSTDITEQTGGEQLGNGQQENADGNGNGNGNENANANGNSNDDGEGQDEPLDDGFADLDSLDLEALRNDPTLRAMIQELVPIQERVRIILRNTEFPSIQIEEEAKAVADQKFSNIFKKIFWKLMGVSWDNIFNWAVLQSYRRRVTERTVQMRNEQEQQAGQTGSAEQAEGSGQAGQEGQSGTSGTDSPEESRDIVEQRV